MECISSSGRDSEASFPAANFVDISRSMRRARIRDTVFAPQGLVAAIEQLARAYPRWDERCDPLTHLAAPFSLMLKLYPDRTTLKFTLGKLPNKVPIAARFETDPHVGERWVLVVDT